MDFTHLIPRIKCAQASFCKALGDRSVVVVCGNRSMLSLFIAGSTCPDALLGAATCEANGLALVKAKRPDLLLCTEHLEDGQGTALVRQSKMLPAAPKVLIVCDSQTPDAVKWVMGSGCDGIFWSRSIDTGTFAEAIRIVDRGGVYVDPQLARLWCSFTGNSGWAGQQLTSRELEVLRLVVQGCSNREISLALHLGINTVKTHLAQVFEKLGVRDRTQAAVQAIALQLVPCPPVRPRPDPP